MRATERARAEQQHSSFPLHSCSQQSGHRNAEGMEYVDDTKEMTSDMEDGLPGLEGQLGLVTGGE